MTTRHLNARLRGLLPGAASVRWTASAVRRELVLTFDDGPDPHGTPAVMDVLDQHRVQATFFVLASRAVEQRALIHEVLAAGHELALHADEHRRLDRLGTATVARVLRDARAQLEDVAQHPIALHRPPFGRVSLSGLRGARRAGLRVLLWSEDPEDFRFTAPLELVGKVAGALRPGAVVLLHDGATTFSGQGQATAGALRETLGLVAERGLTARLGSALW